MAKVWANDLLLLLPPPQSRLCYLLAAANRATTGRESCYRRPRVVLPPSASSATTGRESMTFYRACGFWKNRSTYSFTITKTKKQAGSREPVCFLCDDR